MKNTLAVLLISIITIAGCKKVEELLTFNIDTSANFTIPGFPTTVDTTISITTPNIPTESEEQLSQAGTAKNLVKDIKLSSFTIMAIDPSTQDFDFLKKINIYILADGLPEILLASKDPVPDGTSNTLELDASGSAVDEYIKKPNIQLRIEFGADEALPQDTKVQADMVFTVTADPL